METIHYSAKNYLRLLLFIIMACSVVLVGRWDSPLEAQVRPNDDIEQCANLGTTCDSSNPSQWRNGNLGSSNADYAEGDSVPYRAIYKNLTPGKTYKAVIEWDSVESSHHAIDYLTTYNRTETTADPCAGVTCGSGTATLPIPIDSLVTGGGVTQVPSQVFTAFGATFPADDAVIDNTGGNLCVSTDTPPTCTIENPTSYSYTGSFTGNHDTRIGVYFTATGSTAVLAWGGHIASRIDWGIGNSAAFIAGSPYHMRLVDFACSNADNCSTGNQDRSLSSAAVTVPSSISIIKQATIEGSTQFNFVGSPAPLGSFTLTDDGTAANTRVYSGITTFGTYTVTESATSKWGLDSVSCNIVNQSTGSTSVVGNTASITLGEGEDVTCTFYNSPLPDPGLTLTKTADVENYSGSGQLITYTYVIKNSGNVPIGPTQFTIDDDKINDGAPFACGPAATTLAVDATLSCTAVYTTQAGDITAALVTNTAFAAAGEVVSPSKQVTVPYVATTTTTVAPTLGLTLTKTADVENYSGSGQLITYTYVIKNSGEAPIGPTQFTIDDDKINDGAPFACGPAATTLAVDATVSCTAVYTTQAGDITAALVTNTAFAAAGEVVSPSKQVTVPYVATTTTTVAPTTTTVAPTTTTVAPTTTTVAPTTTTTVPVELQIVTPDNPTGTEDVLDVIFPEELPATGVRVGFFSGLAGVLLLAGLGAITISSNRRSRRRSGRGQ